MQPLQNCIVHAALPYKNGTVVSIFLGEQIKTFLNTEVNHVEQF